MRCFQTVRGVLDELYSQIPLTNEDDKDAVILQELETLRDKYLKLINGETINYSSIITHFAYFYRYVPAHANVIYQLINKTNILNDAFNGEKIHVSCLGGGPGSDFLGLIKYRSMMRKPATLHFDIYDREKTWSNFWTDGAVSDSIKTSSRTFTTFRILDVLCPETSIDCYNLSNTNLITISFLMSEIYSMKERANLFFEDMFKKTKRGTVFVFVDNSSGESHYWFDTLVDKHNMSCSSCIDVLHKSDFVKMDAYEGGSEKMEDLGIFYDKFSRYDNWGRRALPRRNVYLSYRICIKQ